MLDQLQIPVLNQTDARRVPLVFFHALLQGCGFFHIEAPFHLTGWSFNSLVQADGLGPVQGNIRRDFLIVATAWWVTNGTAESIKVEYPWTWPTQRLGCGPPRS